MYRILTLIKRQEERRKQKDFQHGKLEPDLTRSPGALKRPKKVSWTGVRSGKDREGRAGLDIHSTILEVGKEGPKETLNTAKLNVYNQMQIRQRLLSELHDILRP